MPPQAWRSKLKQKNPTATKNRFIFRTIHQVDTHRQMEIRGSMQQPIEVLIPSQEIRKRIEEMAGQISTDYKGKNLVVVGVLKGAFIFMADLIRNISLPLTCDFLRVASYDKDRSTGIVRMEFDLTQPIVGKDVLLVEDIVDTGHTLQYILKHLESQKPASLKVCSLLYKEVNEASRKRIDYLGFTIPNRFVIGYGLDTQGVHRSLPYIGVLAE